MAKLTTFESEDAKRWYNERYDLLKQKSNILNREIVANAHSLIFDKSNVISEIIKFQGDENGKYYERESNIAFTAVLPGLQMKLRELAKMFENWQQMKVDEGREKPTAWPPHLLKEKMEVEASLEIKNLELKNLRTRLNVFNEVKEVERSKTMLKFGPKTDQRIQNGILVEIGGQKVSRLEDGTFFIDDEWSPYNGMRVLDYRRMSLEWSEPRKKRISELSKKRIAEQKLKGFSAIVVPSMSVTVPANKLPAWPSWAEKVKIDK